MCALLLFQIGPLVLSVDCVDGDSSFLWSRTCQVVAEIGGEYNDIHSREREVAIEFELFFFHVFLVMDHNGGIVQFSLVLFCMFNLGNKVRN